MVGSFAINPSVGTLSAAPGKSGSATITTVGAGGFNSAIALSASGQPSFVKVSFNPTSIAAPGSGSSTATFSVAPLGYRPGTYTISITGTGGGETNSTTIAFTVL